MLLNHDLGPRRRALPRVSVEAFCSEHTDEHERHAIILDFSENGLRLQRPIGGPRTRSLQLEFEIPEIDEVVWARGEVCFDQVWQVPPPIDGSGLSGILRTSGVQIVSAAARHQRLLREYVNDTWRATIDVEQHRADTEWFYRSSRYLRC